MKAASILTFLLLVAGVACTAQPPLDKQAHRGGRGLMPENTIPAMLDAIDRNVTTLELDLQISRDKKVVVSHDAYFATQITTTPEGDTLSPKDRRLLYTMDYDSIAKYDVGLKPHPDFPKQKKMPTVKPLLGDLLQATEQYAATKGKTMLYNTEIKSRNGKEGQYHPSVEEFVDLAMEILNAAGVSERTTIQSFDMRALQYMHRQYPTVATSFLIGKNEGRTPTELWDALGFVPTVLSPEYEIVTKEMLVECRKAGVKVIAWTVNDKAEIDKLIDMGVDGIITDYPNLFDN
jgi:glycerophosphoryl diester phosphodiesterase